MQEALFYDRDELNKVKCHLCPRECLIDDGKFGNCNARVNHEGQLIAETFGKLSSLNLDPIEKKPLYHFFPGSEILSVGSTGCNLHCVFCQNHTISQCSVRKSTFIRSLSPQEVANMAANAEKNIGIAFTYNEPIVGYEFVLETAKLVKHQNMATVMVSNGYISPQPLEPLLEIIDAFNIDLKAFDETFYRKYTKATLEPVKNTLKRIARSKGHLEITNLVIPTMNDDCDQFEEMCKWIAGELGEETVLHLSRYFPRYELGQYPTPLEVLFELYDIARSILKYVYIGNVVTEIHGNTVCPQCGKTVIKRAYYRINKKGLDDNGECKYCGCQVVRHI